NGVGATQFFAVYIELKSEVLTLFKAECFFQLGRHFELNGNSFRCFASYIFYLEGMKSGHVLNLVQKYDFCQAYAMQDFAMCSDKKGFLTNHQYCINSEIFAATLSAFGIMVCSSVVLSGMAG